jgi:glutamyl-tRNA synthetase
LKPRAKTLVEIADMAAFYFHTGPLTMDEKATKLLTPEAKQHLKALTPRLDALPSFTSEAIEGLFNAYATENGLKLGVVAQPLRAALSGSSVSPPIFGAAALLGKDESLKRLRAVLG